MGKTRRFKPTVIKSHDLTDLHTYSVMKSKDGNAYNTARVKEKTNARGTRPGREAVDFAVTHRME